MGEMTNIIYYDNKKKMIFNCLNCGVSISSHTENCPHCKISTMEALEQLTGRSNRKEPVALKGRVKGTILSFVTR